MRHPPPFVWEIAEAEDEAWEELITVPAVAPPRQRRGASWAIVASVIGVLTLLCGLRLWQEAEQGAALVEHDIGQVVQLEAVQARLAASSRLEESAVDTAMESVEFNFAGAMARVVVTKTTPGGQFVTYTEARFYRRQGARWERCAPIPAFWGSAATLDTPTLHFEYFVRDQAFVDWYAPALDAYHLTVRTLLGLPPLAESARITIALVPAMRSSPFVLHGDRIVQLSPVLFPTSAAASAGALCERTLQESLLKHALGEALAAHPIRPEWKSAVEHLETWIRAHAGQLPAPGARESASVRTWTQPAAHYELASLNHEYVADSARGYAAYRNTHFAAAVLAFYDFAAFHAGAEALPALLTAFARCDGWEAVATSALDMPAAELNAAWDAYQRTPAPPLNIHRATAIEPKY